MDSQSGMYLKELPSLHDGSFMVRVITTKASIPKPTKGKGKGKGKSSQEMVGLLDDSPYVQHMYTLEFYMGNHLRRALNTYYQQGNPTIAIEGYRITVSPGSHKDREFPTELNIKYDLYADPGISIIRCNSMTAYHVLIKAVDILRSFMETTASEWTMH